MINDITFGDELKRMLRREMKAGKQVTSQQLPSKKRVGEMPRVTT